MNFKDYSAASRELIEKNLLEFFSSKKKNDPPSFGNLNAIKTLEKFVMKGKLIRGTLFLLSTELLGGKVTKGHIEVACAIELVHSALLIQDDFIDRDRTRRGGKTIFVTYEEKGIEINASDPLHYGMSMAIVVADVAFFLAFELLSRFDTPSLGKVLSSYSKDLYFVALAQGLDSQFGQTEVEPSKEDILTVYRYKTARYTFSLPFVMAGIAAGCDKSSLQTLDDLGENAGIIFQLKDDMIGLLGDETVIGKPVGSDIRENKKTLLRQILFEKATGEDRKQLEETFGNNNLTRQHVINVRGLYEKYGIEAVLNEKIEGIMSKVWDLFERLEGEAEFKQTLKDLLEFNVKRTV